MTRKENRKQKGELEVLVLCQDMQLKNLTEDEKKKQITILKLIRKNTDK